MFCPNCGNEIKDGDLFCGECGFKIDGNNAGTESAQINKQKSIAPVVCSVVVVIAIIGGLAFYFGNKSKSDINVAMRQSVDYNHQNNNNTIEDNSYYIEETSTIQYSNQDNISANATNELTSQIIYANVVSDYGSNTTIDMMDTVRFGNYIQGNNYQPIEWIVLKKDSVNGKAFLLSKYILDCKKYNEVRSNVYWSTSTIRQWLNSYFYDSAFNDSEKNMIMDTLVFTNQNSLYGTGGDSSRDKVFLLSIEECFEYFGYGSLNGHYYNIGNIIATRGTEYAKSINNGTLKVDGGGFSPYWLRSTGVETYDAADVKEDGNVDAEGYFVERDIIGVRPAIWINY